MQRQANSYFLIFQEDKLILRDDYTPFEHPANFFDPADLKYVHAIGDHGGKTVYCAEWVISALPSDVMLLPIRAALERLPPLWYALIARAISILRWDKQHSFCGQCGLPTYKVDDRFEKYCDRCQLLVYPRISPSVIVLIEKGDELLMARSPHFLPGVFGLIAGFVEVGEGLEEAVHREVMEEVGIKIKELRYMGSQAWPFPDSLMIAFRAHYASGELRIDHNEIETAGWYHYTALPGLPSSHLSIARQLIDGFLLEKRGANRQ